MSFKQFNVAKINNQSRKIFDTYIYKTDDTCAEVEAVGYFDECRFLINDPDSWNNSIIEVLASDCFTKGIIDNTGNFIPLLGVVGDLFCAPVNLNLGFDPISDTVVLSGANNLTMETLSLASGGQNPYAFTTETFIADANEVKIEAKIVKNTMTGAGVQFFSLLFAQGFPPSQMPTIYSAISYAPFFNFGGGAGLLFDPIAGVPLVQNIGNVLDYELALYINPTTNPVTARFKDSEGNSGSLSALDFTGLEEMQMITLVDLDGEVGAELDIECNFGSSAFSLGDDATRWCAISNQPAFCTPVTWQIQQGTIGSDQLVTQGGTNNLTITAECTQSVNNVSESGVAANQLIPAGFTEEVKIETQITAIPPVPTTNLPIIGLGFFHDLDTVPILVAQMSYVPTLGILIDTIGGLIGGVGAFPFDNPTDMAMYFDPSPQSKIYVFSVGSGIAGSVDVHGVVTNVTGLEQQEDIAANIVANGFTDPTIENIYIGDPSDSRVVYIKYTIASGDAAVSVIPTNVPIFDNYPDDAKPFALYTASAKFFNANANGEFDTPVINYNPLKPLWMASILNSGDVIGGQMISTYNFGSSGFNLGEDAKRWCNL